MYNLTICVVLYICRDGSGFIDWRHLPCHREATTWLLQNRVAQKNTVWTCYNTVNFILKCSLITSHSYEVSFVSSKFDLSHISHWHAWCNRTKHYSHIVTQAISIKMLSKKPHGVSNSMRYEVIFMSWKFDLIPNIIHRHAYSCIFHSICTWFCCALLCCSHVMNCY